MTEQVLTRLADYGVLGVCLAALAAAVWKTLLPLWRQTIEALAANSACMREVLEFMRTLNGELRSAVRRATGEDAER